MFSIMFGSIQRVHCVFNIGYVVYDSFVLYCVLGGVYIFWLFYYRFLGLVVQTDSFLRSKM